MEVTSTVDVPSSAAEVGTDKQMQVLATPTKKKSVQVPASVLYDKTIYLLYNDTVENNAHHSSLISELQLKFKAKHVVTRQVRDVDAVLCYPSSSDLSSANKKKLAETLLPTYSYDEMSEPIPADKSSKATKGRGSSAKSASPSKSKASKTTVEHSPKKRKLTTPSPEELGLVTVAVTASDSNAPYPTETAVGAEGVGGITTPSTGAGTGTEIGTGLGEAAQMISFTPLNSVINEHHLPPVHMDACNSKLACVDSDMPAIIIPSGNSSNESCPSPAPSPAQVAISQMSEVATVPLGDTPHADTGSCSGSGTGSSTGTGCGTCTAAPMSESTGS